jgi:hypothetical protein
MKEQFQWLNLPSRKLIITLIDQKKEEHALTI